MSHSHSQIWIHAIWSTKYRMPLIHPEMESQLYDFMKAEFEKMGCLVRIINGMPDHIHCLISLPSKHSTAEVIKQVKGSSSSFINKSNLLSETFAWQTGYAVFSVSKSVLATVCNYIKNQKEHHRTLTFQIEYKDLVSADS